jgi:hypothetical protein
MFGAGLRTPPTGYNLTISRNKSEIRIPKSEI